MSRETHSGERTSVRGVGLKYGQTIHPDEVDEARFAQIVCEIVRLVGQPANPDLLDPAALILSRAELISADDVTFGCDYNLNVKSIELAEGYVYACSMNWLYSERGHVTVSEVAPISPAEPSEKARQLAAELFSLDRPALHERARPLLLGARPELESLEFNGEVVEEWRNGSPRYSVGGADLVPLLSDLRGKRVSITVEPLEEDAAQSPTL